MELRESILEGTLKAFNQKGLKGITFLSDGRLSVRFNQRERKTGVRE